MARPNKYAALAKRIRANSGYIQPRPIGSQERADLLFAWQNAQPGGRSNHASVRQFMGMPEMELTGEDITGLLAVNPVNVRANARRRKAAKRKNGIAEMELLGENRTGLFRVVPVNQFAGLGRANARRRKNDMASISLRGEDVTGLFPVTPWHGRGARPNITRKQLELLEEIRSAGNLEARYAALATQLYPQRDAIDQLDKFMADFRGTGFLRDYKRDRSRKATVATRESTRAETQAALRAALQAEGINDLVKAEVEKLLKRQAAAAAKKKSKAAPGGPARANPGGVTGLALAMPRSNGRANMAKGKRKWGSPAQVRAFNKMQAARGRANPISRSKAARLAQLGLVEAMTPAAAKRARAALRGKSATPKRSQRSAFGHPYEAMNLAAKLAAAEASPASWVFVKSPQELRQAGGVRASAADVARLKGEVSRLKSKISSQGTVKSGPGKMTAEAAAAAVAGLPLTAAQRKRIANALSRGRKSRSGRVRPSSIPKLQARIAMLEGVGVGDMIPKRWTDAGHSAAVARGRALAARRGGKAARSNSRRNFNLSNAFSSVGQSFKAKPGATIAWTAAGAVGFFVLSSAVRKMLPNTWAGDTADGVARWGVGVGGGLFLLSGWSFAAKIPQSARVGLGVGLIVGAVLRDLVGKFLYNNVEALRPYIPAPVAGFGSVYDRAFDDLDGMGRYVATGQPMGVGRYVATGSPMGLGVDVRAAPAGMGEYLAYNPAYSQSLQGLGVDVSSAVAGPMYTPTAGVSGYAFDNLAQELQGADELSNSDLQFEGFGNVDLNSVKVIQATPEKAQEIQGRYALRLLEESKVNPGTWLVGLDRVNAGGMPTTAGGIGTIVPRATERPIDQLVGRSVVPRGVFENPVFGQRNANFAAIN